MNTKLTLMCRRLRPNRFVWSTLQRISLFLLLWFYAREANFGCRLRFIRGNVISMSTISFERHDDDLNENISIDGTECWRSSRRHFNRKMSESSGVSALIWHWTNAQRAKKQWAKSNGKIEIPDARSRRSMKLSRGQWWRRRRRRPESNISTCRWRFQWNTCTHRFATQHSLASRAYFCARFARRVAHSIALHRRFWSKSFCTNRFTCLFVPTNESGRNTAKTEKKQQRECLEDEMDALASNRNQLLHQLTHDGRRGDRRC